MCSNRGSQAEAEGAEEVGGVEVKLLREPETLPEEVLEKMGAVEAQKTTGSAGENLPG